MHLLFLLCVALTISNEASDPCSKIGKGSIISTIELHGLEYTKEWVIQRHLQHKKGSLFSCQNWKSEKTALENLDIFASVDLDVNSTENTTLLIYRFKELPQIFVFPAIKATDQQGWAGGAGISMLNLAGRDIRLDFYLRTTLYPNTFSATEYMLYAESPTLGDFPLKTELTIIHNNSFNPLVLFTENSFLADLKLYLKIPKVPLELLTLGSIFTLKNDPETSVFEPSDGRRIPIFLSPTQRDWVPTMGIGVVLDTREKIYNPHFGMYGELTVSQSGGVFGGPADYMQLLADIRYFVPFGSDIIVLGALGRYRPGTMGAYDLLHVGGSNTARAYSQDPDQYGQHEALATVEYRLEFFERKPFELWGSNLYYGLQWVFGADTVMQWRRPRGSPKLLTSLFCGPSFLFPGFDRFRIEFGMSNIFPISQKAVFRVSIGLFEKLTMQRQRVR